MYNLDGENITTVFLNTHRDVYLDLNYGEILAACYETVSYIETYEDEITSVVSAESYNTIEPRLVIGGNYTRTVTHFVENDGPIWPSKRWSFQVIASGVYTYNDFTLTYVDFGMPSISFNFIDLGLMFSGSVTSVTTTTPVLSNDNRTATFTVSTEHIVNGPIPGAGELSINLGPFFHESYFQISL